MNQKSFSSYGSIEPNKDSFDPLSSYRKSKSNKMLYLFSGLTMAIFGFCVISMHRSMNHMEQLLLSFQQTSQLSQYHSSHQLFPNKFSVKHVTPRKDQARRGTCWDFSTIGVLEQSYREHGIKKGWLKENEYVAFSEQAYGAEILKLCAGPPSSQQQLACRVAGDSIWQNSTEGGEVPELYYLMNGLKHAVLPHSICPYYTHDGNDSLCPHMEERIQDNPIKFKIKKMETWYDDLTVKRKLVEKKHAMAFSTAMTYVTHYYPCVGKFLSHPSCQANSDQCTLCPPEMPMTSCCVPIPGGNNRNMDGEFISHRGMTIEGGHAMLLVGFNDAFQTKDGFTGGFIVKNSWSDGPTQGSHTLKWWMQEISDWEERTICPNSHLPFNWYQCGNSKPEPYVFKRVNLTESTPKPTSSSKFQRSNAFDEGIQACLSKETKMYADVNYQPLELRCIDSTQCHTNTQEYVYYVRNSTDWGDRMYVMCMWEYNKMTKESKDFCLLPSLELDIAKVFQPIKTLENDPNFCGFYFFPYAAIRKYISQFSAFFINSFDIEWDPQSYLHNSKKYPHLNYEELQKSTKLQNYPVFDGPFPFAKVIKK